MFRFWPYPLDADHLSDFFQIKAQGSGVIHDEVDINQLSVRSDLKSTEKHFTVAGVDDEAETLSEQPAVELVAEADVSAIALHVVSDPSAHLTPRFAPGWSAFK